MNTLILLFLILSAVLLLLAAVGIRTPRVHLGWLGLFFFVLTWVVPKLA